MRIVQRRVTRLTVVAACLVALAACGRGSGVPASTEQVRSAGHVTLKQVCSASLCTGSRADAAFKIETPAKGAWNGTLLIWSHGYRSAGPIPSDPLNAKGPLEQPVTVAEDAPADQIAQTLLSQGYAIAGSAYKSNGWAVQDGVAADKDLYSYFAKTFGTPKRVYVWGASLGGLITQTLAEKPPSWLSGAAPVCGVLGGTNLNLDLALDVAYAVKKLIYPSLKLTGFASQEEAVQQWQSAAQAVAAAATKGGPAITADLLAIKAISGAPDKTASYDGRDATSQGSAIVESIITALGYGTWGRYDIEQRLGGDPSKNDPAGYAARVSTSTQTLINAVAPGQLSRVLQALASGPAVTPDQAVRAKADTLGNPTGTIAVPTVTMHTEDDPLVISQNENVFARRADAKGTSSGLLVQILTAPPKTYSKAPYGAGHCNFTATELGAVVTLLDNWVRHGQYPAYGAIAQALNYSVDNADTGKNTPEKIADGTADTGYQPVDVSALWPNVDSGSPTS
jgi:alpha-beta hydrolase superfamily lysophospholipase